MPVALENLAVSSLSKKSVITTALETSQFYVIILGCCYGTIPEDDPCQKGFVEIELDIAKENKLEVLALVMDKQLVDEYRATKEFISSKEAKLVEKYDNLRKELTEGANKYFYKPFVTAEDIETELYAYFNNIQSDRRGYMLEPEDRQNTEILQITARNDIVRDVVQRLTQFKTVEPRLALEADKKMSLANDFAANWGDNVKKYKRIFFESGSTITYIAKALVDYLPQEKSHGDSIVISNNAFAYLNLWLKSDILCRPVPSGSPDNQYAAMYGELTGRKRKPLYDLKPLRLYDPDALEIINKLNREITGGNGENNTLIIAAISGIQLTDKINAVKIVKNVEMAIPSNHEIYNQLNKCRGFHVGSYENHLFKRSYYLTKNPTIVFVHDEKIDCKIVVGKCHFLCDSEFQWGNFITEYPLSIWAVCNEDTCDDIFKKFNDELSQKYGWMIGIYGMGTSFPIVIGHNMQFKETCKQIGITIPDYS